MGRIKLNKNANSGLNGDSEEIYYENMIYDEATDGIFGIPENDLVDRASYYHRNPTNLENLVITNDLETD